MINKSYFGLYPDFPITDFTDNPLIPWETAQSVMCRIQLGMCAEVRAFSDHGKDDDSWGRSWRYEVACVAKGPLWKLTQRWKSKTLCCFPTAVWKAQDAFHSYAQRYGY